MYEEEEDTCVTSVCANVLVIDMHPPPHMSLTCILLLICVRQCPSHMH